MSGRSMIRFGREPDEANPVRDAFRRSGSHDQSCTEFRQSVKITPPCRPPKPKQSLVCITRGVQSCSQNFLRLVISAFRLAAQWLDRGHALR